MAQAVDPFHRKSLHVKIFKLRKWKKGKLSYTVLSTTYMTCIPCSEGRDCLMVIKSSS